jgi:hypothetical protein
MLKPSEMIDEYETALRKKGFSEFVAYKLAVNEFLDNNLAQSSCELCFRFKPKAPGSVSGTCPLFTEEVSITFGCRKFSR